MKDVMADQVTARSAPSESDGKYLPHPAGQHVVTCVDVIDLGEELSDYAGQLKIQAKVALLFASGKQNPETGEPFVVAAELTNSMFEKANLRKLLESWRGQPYTDQQAEKGVPLHKLVGQSGIASIAHKTSKAGRTYAKLMGLIPLMEGMQAPTITGYVRPKFWETKKAEYAEAVAKHRATEAAHAPHGFDEMPEGLEGSDDLPW